MVGPRGWHYLVRMLILCVNLWFRNSSLLESSSLGWVIFSPPPTCGSVFCVVHVLGELP